METLTNTTGPEGVQPHDHQPTPSPAPHADDIILHGTYQLVRQLGYGGMGVVYEAVHTRLPGRFAVKALLRSLLAYPEALARFAREAAIMSELRHPHVVQIVDFNVTEEHQPYFVMEFLEGQDLDTELAQRGALPLHETVTILGAVASALGLAHRRGIVHRDLKPSNVFLCEVEGWQEPFVKVLDFGVSSLRSASRITTNGTAMLGTPHYMAPEQATGRIGDIDGRTDQFSLAAMAYEMLTGHDAFAGEDQVSLLYQIVHQDPPPLSRYLPWRSDGVQEVLSRGLAKEPRHRYPTITEFSAAFAEAARAVMSGPMAVVATPAPVALGVPARAGGPGIAESSHNGNGSGNGNGHSNAAADADDAAAIADADGVDEFGRSSRTPEPDVGTPSELRAIRDDDTGTYEVRVPRKPYRAVALAIIAIALGALAIKKGWAHDLPDNVLISARSLAARWSGRPPLLQPDRSTPEPVLVPANAAQPLPPELTPTDRREAARHP
jgi:serine/threonine protein kinase